MEELLGGVSAAVAAIGVETFCHRGYISDVAAPGTRFVVVPHEYFAVAPEEADALYKSSIAFGVEHPGTLTFQAAADQASRLGAHFEISRDAIGELTKRGIVAHHFLLGYVGQWDMWRGQEGDRPVDVAYLGTADERRVGLLSRCADDLEGLECELLLPPHEPMTRSRPDFVIGEAKWRLLARSKVLINLHREESASFEWVRCLEAIVNGCVVVSEASTDLEPLVAGEHVVMAEPSRVGAVARALVQAPVLRSAIARRAYEVCRTELDMRNSAELLVKVASTLPGARAGANAVTHERLPRGDAGESQGDGEQEAPMAVWVPGSRELPQPIVDSSGWVGQRLEEMAGLRPSLPRLAVVRRSASRADVDVLCVHQPGDGPVGATIASVEESGVLGALHLAVSPGSAGDELAVPDGVATYLSADLLLGRGRARNMLVEMGSAPLLCVLDSGDTVRGNTLAALLMLMNDEPETDIAFAMATYGARSMANALVPEKRRLLTRAYLTRGYLVRRQWLNDIGGFTEDPYLQDFVDHAFWLRSCASGASVRLMRCIGFKLWARGMSQPE